MFSNEKSKKFNAYSNTLSNKDAFKDEKIIHDTDDLVLNCESDNVEEINNANGIKEREHEKVRTLLRKDEQTDDELENNVDKIYDLADILYDIWIKNKEKNL